MKDDLANVVRERLVGAFGKSLDGKEVGWKADIIEDLLGIPFPLDALDFMSNNMIFINHHKSAGACSRAVSHKGMKHLIEALRTPVALLIEEELMASFPEVFFKEETEEVSYQAAEIEASGDQREREAYIRRVELENERAELEIELLRLEVEERKRGLVVPPQPTPCPITYPWTVQPTWIGYQDIVTSSGSTTQR